MRCTLDDISPRCCFCHRRFAQCGPAFPKPGIAFCYLDLSNSSEEVCQPRCVEWPRPQVRSHLRVRLDVLEIVLGELNVYQNAIQQKQHVAYHILHGGATRFVDTLKIVEDEQCVGVDNKYPDLRIFLILHVNRSAQDRCSQLRKRTAYEFSPTRELAVARTFGLYTREYMLLAWQESIIKKSSLYLQNGLANN